MSDEVQKLMNDEDVFLRFLKQAEIKYKDYSYDRDGIKKIAMLICGNHHLTFEFDYKGKFFSLEIKTDSTRLSCFDKIINSVKR